MRSVPAWMTLQGEDVDVVDISPVCSVQVPLVKVDVLVYPEHEAAAQLPDILKELRRIADELPASLIQFASEVRQARFQSSRAERESSDPDLLPWE
jgi:hypothetical protein